MTSPSSPSYGEPLLNTSVLSDGDTNPLSLSSIPSPPSVDDAPVGSLSKQYYRTTNSFRLCGVWFNYWMLACICFLTFGSYWVYDTPGALLDQFKQWFGKGYSNASNDAMYSVYSFPNTVLPLFGGYIVDRLSAKKSCVLFAGLVGIGDFLFCVGIEYKLYWLCLVGRFVFGLGGESLTVAQNTYTIRWFDGKYLALAFGLVVAFSRVGTSVNFIVSPIFADPPFGVPFSCWFGCLMCGISLSAALFGGVLDRWASDKIDTMRVKHFVECSPEQRIAILKADEKAEPVNDPINIKDLKDFPLESWLLYLITMFFYIAILTFNTVAQDILTNTGNKYSQKEAGVYMSIPSFVAIGASPSFGFLVDRVGKGLYWIAFASLGMMFCHIYYLAMAYDFSVCLTLGPIPVQIVIGIFYSMGASSLWPILSFVLDKKAVGTGYGVMTAIQNFGLGLFPLLIGGIQSSPSVTGTLQYTLPIIVFISCTGVAAVLTFILIRVDASRGSRLNASAGQRAERKRLDKEKEEDEERIKEKENALNEP